MSNSEGKTQIATLYRDTTSGEVEVKWTYGPEIPIKTGSGVAAVIRGKASIFINATNKAKKWQIEKRTSKV